MGSPRRARPPILLQCALVCAATGSAPAQQVGYDRGAFATSLDERFSLRAGAQFQFRYIATFDADATADSGPTEDDASGFQYQRTRLSLAGHMLDPRLTFSLLANADRTMGDLRLQEASADLALTEALALRLGQFKAPFDREFSATSPTQLLLSERSLAANVFRLDYVQGAQLSYQTERWRVVAATTSGRRSLNTGFYEPGEAEWALTARAEARLVSAPWRQWRDMTSFRSSKLGVLVGGGVHWQREGSTGQADADTLLAWTADLGLEGPGFNALLAYSGRRFDAGGDSLHDHALIAQGGVFVHERVEPFARFTWIAPDDTRENGDHFRAINAGLNYHIFPESHAAKVTLEIAHAFDTQADSASLVTAPADAQALLPDASGSQTGLILQVQLLF